MTRERKPEGSLDTVASKQKPNGYLETLAEKITTHVDRLEGLVEGIQSADDQKLAKVKKGLASFVEKAIALKAEYEALLERFGPALERMEALKMDILRTFPGYNNLDNIAEDAKRIRQAFTEAIAWLGRLPAQVEALSLKDLFADVQGRIRDDLQTHVGGPDRMKEKVEKLLNRMEAFERARKA